MAHISVVGSGIVGQATGKGFLALGHSVQFIDINPRIIEDLRSQGHTAVFPRQADWTAADMTMLSVNTPTVDGRIVLDHLLGAVETLGSGLAGSRTDHIVVVRSTVPPTTTERVIRPLLERHAGRLVGPGLGLCMNPEFLRQVSAEQDFLNPWLTVVGSSSPFEATIMQQFYEPFGAPIVQTDCTTAETIKYANNLYNATKISFFNEFHLVCEHIGADSSVVGRAVARSAEGMWNPSYGTRAGWAYGGACLPKDTTAFLAFAGGQGIEMPVLSGTVKVNEIMERRNLAPASMQEVVPIDVLATEALALASHAATVATSGALDPDATILTNDLPTVLIGTGAAEMDAVAD